MCKVGDIIVVDQYKDSTKTLSRHSFVVIDDKNGQIEGFSYDMICNVLSSFKDEKQIKRKLSYPGNFPIANEDTITCPNNNKDGYIKTDQLYFFAKDKINYTVIGSVKEDIFNLIMEFINESDFQITAIIDNL